MGKPEDPQFEPRAWDKNGAGSEISLLYLWYEQTFRVETIGKEKLNCRPTLPVRHTSNELSNKQDRIQDLQKEGAECQNWGELDWYNSPKIGWICMIQLSKEGGRGQIGPYLDPPLINLVSAWSIKQAVCKPE